MRWALLNRLSEFQELRRHCAEEMRYHVDVALSSMLDLLAQLNAAMHQLHISGYTVNFSSCIISFTTRMTWLRIYLALYDFFSVQSKFQISKLSKLIRTEMNFRVIWLCSDLFVSKVNATYMHIRKKADVWIRRNVVISSYSMVVFCFVKSALSQFPMLQNIMNIKFAYRYFIHPFLFFKKLVS